MLQVSLDKKNHWNLSILVTYGPNISDCNGEGGNINGNAVYRVVCLKIINTKIHLTKYFVHGLTIVSCWTVTVEEISTLIYRQNNLCPFFCSVCVSPQHLPDLWLSPTALTDSVLHCLSRFCLC